MCHLRGKTRTNNVDPNVDPGPNVFREREEKKAVSWAFSTWRLFLLYFSTCTQDLSEMVVADQLAGDK